MSIFNDQFILFDKSFLNNQHDYQLSLKVCKFLSKVLKVTFFQKRTDNLTKNRRNELNLKQIFFKIATNIEYEIFWRLFFRF